MWQYITNSAVQVEQNVFPSELESANCFVARMFSQNKQTGYGTSVTRPGALTVFFAAIPYPITRQVVAQL